MIDTGVSRDIARSYFKGLAEVRKLGGTKERSSYPVLAELLNAVGALLAPKVLCVSEIADQGAGHPDFGLFSAKQVRGGRPGENQVPEFGVVEVKSADDDAWLTARGNQVTQYWRKYRLVLVTNVRDFVLVGDDEQGRHTKIGILRLAESAEEFGRLLDKPESFARESGPRLVEFLVRALSHRATISSPRDLAVLLASHAREALSKVEAAGDIPSLQTFRKALEEALGIHFKGEKGSHFFRSTLVQTLFYGLFSAWVLWARSDSKSTREGPLFDERESVPKFDWHREVRALRVPVLQALFWQISDPAHLESLGLSQSLDRASGLFNRVDRASFFGRITAGDAVPYFYEPFLEAFDPGMRKQLGVWYTPPEVVRYMVARVDLALRDDLGIEEGLAAENVYVLDPCCGTGAYLSEVLRRISAKPELQGQGALAGEFIRKAVTGRLFGFEIMPAPFVVAHMQVGLMLEELNAPLGDDQGERPQIFLTNALTGWQPDTESKPLPFPGLEEERNRSRKVKQQTPILVILGNPPYHGFAEAAENEERRLTEAYRNTRRVESPQGSGLNDLYVRFFRVAERHVTESAGEGIVCFISNYSWLDGLSFTGMRERFLEEFDAIRIDCLNGDSRATGKKTPDGSPDPSVFSTEGSPVGIQVGTAVATLVRKKDHSPASSVELRQLWGTRKRETLFETAEADPRDLYEEVRPDLSLGLPFLVATVSKGWPAWPSLPEIFPCRFPGVKTARDAFLVDIDLDRLKARVADYFNRELTHDEVASCHLSIMESKPPHYDARRVRDRLLERGGPREGGFVRYAFRPFDIRWLYWEGDSGLLSRPSPSYVPHLFAGNKWLVAQQKPRKEWSPAQVISVLGCGDLMDRGASVFPLWLNGDGVRDEDHVGSRRRTNLTCQAEKYLRGVGASEEDLYYHVLACLHDPAYQRENAGALRTGWPRIPVPGWPKGKGKGAADKLAASATRGRKIAGLLDACVPVPGVTTGGLRPWAAAIAVPSRKGGGNMAGDDFVLSPKWGSPGANAAVMPGKGIVGERPCTKDEKGALGKSKAVLGKDTRDVFLNGRTYWSNVPAAVWEYRLGGYQVLKKWLSYRSERALGRPMRKEEVLEFAGIARRIAGILVAASGKGD